MHKEISVQKIISPQQFVDAMADQRQALEKSWEEVLSPDVTELVINARHKIQEYLNLNPESFTVIFGEQAYGLNERPKVVGKRLLGRALERHGVQQVELFANYDSAASEAGIRRMELPNPHTADGVYRVNILTGWKKKTQTPTAAFRSPSEEELQKIMASLRGNYSHLKAMSFVDYLRQSYTTGMNYADANIDLLRKFQEQIGLVIERFVTEDKIDTKIAQSGGMEIMLKLWPSLSEASHNNGQENVRVPDMNEAPFYIYHRDGACNGRMHGTFQEELQQIRLDSCLSAKCLECGHTENLTPQEVVDSQRIVTWRAIPRVFLYSALGVADGHITGGESVYNDVVAKASGEIGIPYFPITWMDKKDANGNLSGIFQYESFANTRKNDLSALPGYQNSVQTVNDGSAAMADLIISIGMSGLKQAVNEFLEKQVSTASRVQCPPPLPKNMGIFD